MLKGAQTPQKNSENIEKSRFRNVFSSTLNFFKFTNMQTDSSTPLAKSTSNTKPPNGKFNSDFGISSEHLSSKYLLCNTGPHPYAILEDNLAPEKIRLPGEHPALQPTSSHSSNRLSQICSKFNQIMKQKSSNSESDEESLSSTDSDGCNKIILDGFTNKDSKNRKINLRKKRLSSKRKKRDIIFRIIQQSFFPQESLGTYIDKTDIKYMFTGIVPSIDLIDSVIRRNQDLIHDLAKPVVLSTSKEWIENDKATPAFRAGPGPLSILGTRKVRQKAIMDSRQRTYNYLKWYIKQHFNHLTLQAIFHAEIMYSYILKDSKKPGVKVPFRSLFKKTEAFENLRKEYLTRLIYQEKNKEIASLIKLFQLFYSKKCAVNDVCANNWRDRKLMQYSIELKGKKNFKEEACEWIIIYILRHPELIRIGKEEGMNHEFMLELLENVEHSNNTQVFMDRLLADKEFDRSRPLSKYCISKSIANPSSFMIKDTKKEDNDGELGYRHIE